jgi:hypothetical protein
MRAGRAAALRSRATGRFPGAMRMLIAVPVMIALIGAVGCGEEKTVSDDEIVQALSLERDDDEPVYAVRGDEFCQVDQELLNDSAEVEDAESDKRAQVITDSDGAVGIEAIPPFDPRCEEDARRALNRLGKEDE